MRFILLTSMLLLVPLPLSAQQARPGGNPAVAGYVYPAGGQAGSEIEITVGGMALGGTRAAIFSGDGLSATILKHYKPINNLLRNKIRDLLKAEREQLAKARSGGGGPASPRKAAGAKRFIPDREILTAIAERENIGQDDLNAFLEEATQRRDPKRQPNAQLAERLTLRLTIPQTAATGRRELRLLGPNGLSNPLVFIVGKLPEITETEANEGVGQVATTSITLPAVLNGRVLPGDVDSFAFDARKGMRLTATVAARELTPYLADAVPGWFQATLALIGEDGRELAFSGGFDHRPDPLLCATIPADGRYTLAIRDSLCRGREDFVYRITAGEIPCLTEQFPLGGRLGSKVPVRVSGWNLADYQAIIEVGSVAGWRQIPPRPPILGCMWFEASPYPDFVEDDSDAASPNPWQLAFPCTANGIIRRPGEADRYALPLKAGQEVVAEVRARRLGSPLDANLRVIGPDHKTVAANDDCDDPASGLLTHHADPRAAFTAPADGIYQFEITDTQGKGSRGHAYRLTVAPPQPDFELRVTPSALNGRAGALVPFTVHLLRRDGFAGEVNLGLADPPPGYSLVGGQVAAGTDTVQCTLKLAHDASPGVIPIRIEGAATINGSPVTRAAQPADDRMQAFFYRHLVPAAELLACVTGRANNANRPRLGLLALDRLRPLCAAGVTLPAGGSATLDIPRAITRNGQRNLIFSLSNPPPGISLASKPGDKRIDLVFSADASQVKPGALGNLIVQVSTVAPPRKGNPKAKPQTVKLGTLPPIPCVVTAR